MENRTCRLGKCRLFIDPISIPPTVRPPKTLHLQPDSRGARAVLIYFSNPGRSWINMCISITNANHHTHLYLWINDLVPHCRHKDRLKKICFPPRCGQPNVDHPSGYLSLGMFGWGFHGPVDHVKHKLYTFQISTNVLYVPVWSLLYYAVWCLMMYYVIFFWTAWSQNWCCEAYDIIIVKVSGPMFVAQRAFRKGGAQGDN